MDEHYRREVRAVTLKRGNGNRPEAHVDGPALHTYGVVREEDHFEEFLNSGTYESPAVIPMTAIPIVVESK